MGLRRPYKQIPWVKGWNLFSWAQDHLYNSLQLIGVVNRIRLEAIGREVHFLGRAIEQGQGTMHLYSIGVVNRIRLEAIGKEVHFLDTPLLISVKFPTPAFFPCLPVPL